MEGGTIVRTGKTRWILIPSNWICFKKDPLVVWASCVRAVNYALYHCGTPIVGELHAMNSGKARSEPGR